MTVPEAEVARNTSPQRGQLLLYVVFPWAVIADGVLVGALSMLAGQSRTLAVLVLAALGIATVGISYLPALARREKEIRLFGGTLTGVATLLRLT